MSARSPGFVLLWALASASTAMAMDTSAPQRWAERDDAALVVLVLDGLQEELVTAVAADGAPLMPHLARLRAQSTVFNDCLSTSPSPTAGLYSLLTGESPTQALAPPREVSVGVFAQRDWDVAAWVAPIAPWADLDLRVRLPRLFHGGQPRSALQPRDVAWGNQQSAALDSVMAWSLQSTRPSITILVADLLHQPALVTDATLQRTDDSPWHGGNAPMTMERLMNARLRRGQAWAKAPEPRPWIQRANHALADSHLARLLRRLEDESDRVAVVVSAVHSANPDPARRDQNPLRAAVTHVPLWLRFPKTKPSTVEAPVTTRQVGQTLGQLLTAPASAGPLFRATELTRWSMAWWDTTVRRAPASVGAVKFRNDRFALVLSPPEQPRLFDLQFDPRELHDLGASQPDVIQRLSQEMVTALAGERLQVRVAVVAQGPRTFTATATPMSIDPELTGQNLEADDELVSLGGETLWVEFHLDQELDGFVSIEATGLGTGRLEVQSGVDDAWPIYLGPRAVDGNSTLEWRVGSKEFFTMLAPAAMDQVAWAEGRPDGVYVWLTPSGGYLSE